MRLIDSFAGGGGASTGIRWALGREVDAAINHSATALKIHALNHPTSLHLCDDIYQVHPAKLFEGDTVSLFWASPDCKHFSQAKGGKPVDQKIRGLPWSVVGWARKRHAEVIIVENVPPFQTWGPLDENDRPIKARAGESFRRWIAAFRAAGYVVEWRVLCAHDFGAPTSRRRLFVIARCDGKPIVWPEPTHGDPDAPRTLFSRQLLPWRTAASCIDWSIPAQSIFERTRPLADNTLMRIAAGIRDLVIDNPKPFVVPPNRAPVLIQTGYGERPGQAPRVLDLHRPMGTLVAGGCKQGLVEAWLTRVGLDDVAVAGDHREDVRALLVKYYGNETAGQSLDHPLDTVTTRHRFGLVLVEGAAHIISDIRFRMLSVRECARGQGFPDSYDLGDGTESEQLKMIGNSVVPQLAEALVRANVGAAS